MKFIEISVSNDTFVDSEIKHVEDLIPETIKRTPEFSIIFPQVKLCIKDFSERAKKLALEGTTIHIKKEFCFPGVSVSVILKYPRTASLIERIKRSLKRV